jgi:hypothetical protein
MLSIVRQVGLVAFGLVAIGTISSAQVTTRRPTVVRAGEEEKTKVTLSLDVGNTRFDGATQARCTHAPIASIYNTVAEMWSVEYSAEGNRSLHLTVWRPTSGDPAPQISFYAGSGGKNQQITTVKGAGEQKGKGTVAITKRGAGGRFDITGTTADGASVRGYIECEKFSAPMAVGGN